MEICIGCQREFKSVKSLNSHKRFCQKWQELGLARSKHTISLEKRKLKPEDCPNCGKTFKNVYAMSSHKAWCLGLNSYESRSQEAKNKMAWSAGKTVFTSDYLSKKHPVSEVFLVGKTKKHLRKWVFKIFDCKCCMECGIEEWNGKTLSFDIHHVDGVSSNNVLSNLQILCPNCHSQTWNFRRRKSEFVSPSKTLHDHVKEWLKAMNAEIKSEHFRKSLEETLKKSECKKLLAQV